MATKASDVQTMLKGVIDAKDAFRSAMQALPDEPVEDWMLRKTDGSEVALSELFGDKTELLVVHNMGKHCNYCSLWADGFIGLAPHIMERCGFALCSDDAPEIAGAFARERGWTYPVVSGNGSGFAQAMGYRGEDGMAWPGVSAFHKQADGSIVRTGHAPFGPGDDFCGVWPMLDLIKGGKGAWEPRHGGPGGSGSGSSGSCCCS
jgi:predicted dithiol-disulfide oxidoreductase (DUF899 family)